MNLPHRKEHFDQKYKLSNKNDMLCPWRNFQKHSCGISIYDKWNFKPQISSIFHFDRISDNCMVYVLGVKQTSNHLQFQNMKNCLPILNFLNISFYFHFDVIWSIFCYSLHYAVIWQLGMGKNFSFKNGLEQKELKNWMT